MNFFDYLNSLSLTKRDLFSEYGGREYSQFMINRGFSQHRDVIYLANIMNEYGGMVGPCLTDRMHHDFLLNTVDRRRRVGKWIKADPLDGDANTQSIMTYFDCSLRDALLYLEILTEDQIKEINELTDEGGKYEHRNKIK